MKHKDEMTIRVEAITTAMTDSINLFLETMSESKSVPQGYLLVMIADSPDDKLELHMSCFPDQTKEVLLNVVEGMVDIIASDERKRSHKDA